MTSRMTLRTLLAAGAVCCLAACMAPNAATGPDRSTGSDASTVTWQDGKPAFAISCKEPGGCQERAQAMCNHGNIVTLKSENMPTAGTARAALGPPSLVIRCG